MNPESSARRAAVTGLAIVGFIALVVLGLWLAVSLARSLSGGGGLGAAADYVGSMFTPRPNTSLSVVPTASTTIPFGDTTVSTTTDESRETPATTTPTTTKQTAPAPTYYRTVTTTYPVTGATRIPATKTTYSGKPDLIVTIVDVGYTDSDGDFVPDSTIGRSDDLAAVILVTNIGTDKTGPYDIEVTVPTSSDSTFTRTETMDSLEPNQPVTIDLKLSKGRPRVGTHDITITVDPDDDINESKENNNTDSAEITVN